MPENLVTLRVFNSEVEAELAKGQLEGSGIPAYIFKDGCGNMYPNLQLARGIELKVQAVDESQAQDILRVYTLNVVTDEDDDGAYEVINQETMMINEAKNLAKKAFFLLIISIGTVPGLITLPIAFTQSRQALELINRTKSASTLLKAGIWTIIMLSGFMTIVYLVIAMMSFMKKYSGF
ncbi:putative signal transducing protein [Desulforegula conservatrix]|uniref:putative signal transducing protein n=1 Tax=Desulforegula conservatrix TaxID=153026 RepID=UPI00041DB9AE|nr:DUF2007 domain-containing protein [Desulforegula conservatrix]